MDKRDVEYQIADLKADYVRLQQNLEKLEYVKGNLHPLEKQLAEIEQALKKLYQQLDRF
ncbi:SE1832 family protein [Weizmannia sp. FSL K6-0777]|uniref:SE1832 family protein n=1 Tax=Weizmannia sp. FSL K6-0777 TaxID=2954674 RepID=UPI0031592C6D